MLQNCAIDAPIESMNPSGARPPPLVVAYRRIAFWLLGCLCVVMLSGCAAIDRWQRSKIYRPTPLQGVDAKQQLLQANPEVSVQQIPSGEPGEWVDVLQLPALLAPPKEIRVLYLHGTFRHAFRNIPKTVPMRRAGMAVWVPDYRGWGGSSPILPDEDSIHSDAWTVWQALQAQTPARGQVRWVIYGHSMGSAVAVRLARRLQSQNAYCALVLESAFTNFSDVAHASVGWVGRALVGMGSQRMDAAGDIGGVDGPVWFLHGSRDDTVPMALGQKLFALAPEPKHFREWPLEHSNLHTDTSGSYDATWQDIARSCAP